MHALKLGNAEFEGRNNAYLLQHTDETTLIDTGIATAETDQQLRDHLATHGHDFSDIDTIILTHWHPDHTGLAGTIQHESGATVYVHEADAPIVQQDETAIKRMQALQRERFDEWGMPAEKRNELLKRLDGSDAIAGDPVSVETITDGENLEIGASETQLRVLHAPGHSAGLCCFEFDGANDSAEAFVGDALLPVYTPNVGGADVRVDRPLERYLDTLRTISERGYSRVWPGHRDVIDNPAERAQFIIDHHRERAERVSRVLAEHGPANAWEVSAHLFGDLEGIHVMHGPGEAYAHLDHLEHHDIVVSTPDGYDLRSDAESTIDAVI